MDQVKLIELAMNASACKSLRALAEITEIDVGSLSRWAKDEREITLEGVLILAKLASLKPEAVAGQVVKPRTNSKLLRQVLKEWAKVAAALLLSAAAPHADAGIQFHNAPQPVYYVKY